VSLLIISLKSSSFFELRQQVRQAAALADWIEIRLDLMPNESISDLMSLSQLTTLPILWTLRTTGQGGAFEGSSTEYLARLRELLTWNPAWIDLEAWVHLEDYQTLVELSPQTGWIVSWHELAPFSQNLENYYQQLIRLPATYYKLALFVHTAVDSLRLLDFAKEKNQQVSSLCVIGLGKQGQSTRILAPVVNCPFTYAALSKKRKTALGQLTAYELLKTYHWRDLNSQTQLFGLIGHPVHQSLSHLTHNAVFKEAHLNAVYIKFELDAKDLSPFLVQFQQLNGQGLSVTMPFKEEIVQFLTEPIPYLTCNTLAWKNQCLVGTNTDGIGTLNALGIPVEDEKVLILGAGGAAKAIAQTAVQQGAQVAILNRTPQKADQLAKQIGGKSGSLKDFKTFQKAGFHLIIQATSAGMGNHDTPIPPDQLDSNSRVIEVIAWPEETQFLKNARKIGCETISGREVFIQQALEQLSYWFGSQLDRLLVEKTLRRKIEESTVCVRESQLQGNLRLPASKSHSIRAILLATLCQGISSIQHLLLDSPDIQVALQASQQLGGQINYTTDSVTIQGVAGHPHLSSKIIDVGNSGQVLRFAGALAALSSQEVILTGDLSIRTQRPVQALIEGLHQLGVETLSIAKNGYAPYLVKGPLSPGKVTMNGKDSQPVSALLMAAAFVEGITTIQVMQAGEKPWLQLTLSWLDRLHVNYTHQGLEYFKIQGQPIRAPFQTTIPGDWSSAAFILVAALITHSTVTIEQVPFDDVQGDQAIVPLLQQLGAQISVDREKGELTVHPSPPLKGGIIDVNAIIDAVPILAVLGCFGIEKLILVNGAIARQKECDRLHCIVKELKKMGAIIEETADGLTVSPSSLHGAIVKSYEDHRIALALIVAGLATPEETLVQSTACIRKSYPHFVQQLQELGACIDEEIA